MTPVAQTTITFALEPWMIRAAIVAIPLFAYMAVFVAINASDKKARLSMGKGFVAFISFFTTIIIAIVLGVAYLVGLWVVYG